MRRRQLRLARELPMREMQRRYASWAYEQFGTRKLVTAEKLGLDVKTLSRWLRPDEENPKAP